MAVKGKDTLPILILLGGNQGDVRKNGQMVISKLDDIYGVVRCSSWYESPAWGFEGAPFLNCVVELGSLDSPEKLLHDCLELERELGRVRSGQGYSDRPMDIDILYLGKTIVDLPQLQVPHPKIAERNFTLTPLCEYWSEFSHPMYNKTQWELKAECKDLSPVRKLNK